MWLVLIGQAQYCWNLGRKVMTGLKLLSGRLILLPRQVDLATMAIDALKCASCESGQNEIDCQTVRLKPNPLNLDCGDLQEACLA